MKILFLPNWNVKHLDKDDVNIQAPDKYVKGEAYWFFRHFPIEVNVDIINVNKESVFFKIERKLNFYIIQSFNAFFRASSYDIVISHGAQSGLVFSLLKVLFFRKKPFHLIIDVGGMNGARLNWAETPLLKFALRSKPSVISHNRSLLSFYESTYPKIYPLSTFIKFGVDSDYFKPISTPTKNFALSFGYAKRDYPTLIEAWNSLNTDVTLKIIGIEGKDTPNIIYTPKVSISLLKREISSCLFVIIPLPVFNYSYGQMSFLQSMSLGKPVIVTRTPSSIDYLEGLAGCVLVEPNNSSDLVQKIQCLLKKKDTLNTLGDLVRSYIVKELNEKRMAKEIYDFIIKQNENTPCE